MTTLAPSPTTYDIADVRTEKNITSRAYGSLATDDKTAVKSNIVRWYLKNRTEQGVEAFLERFEGKTFVAKKGDTTYRISSDVVKHVVKNLEINLSRTYGEAVNKPRRQIGFDGRERMYSITQNKVEGVARRLPHANPETELSWDSLRDAYRFRTNGRESKRSGGGFFGVVKKLLCVPFR